VGNGQLEHLTGPGGWGSKLRETLTCLETQAGRDRVVLLCYRPEAWASSAPEDRAFAQRTRELVGTLLLGAGCRRVVAGELPDVIQPRETHTLRPSARGRIEWGPALAPIARALAIQAEEGLSRRTPLEVRLLVGLAAVDTVETAARWALAGASRHALARELRRAFAARPDLDRALALWGRLALVRGPIPSEVVLELGGRALEGLPLELVQECLLYERRGGSWTMHELLRAAARADRAPADEERRSAHATLAGWYAREFERLQGLQDPRALEAQFEAYEHATRAGSELLTSLRPLFIEQLELLGRRLSEAGERARAAEVFRSACAWDDEDDYAHHYLAFNLDVDGRAPEEVEEHYTRALALNPRNAWWHSRWIRFLVAVGRTADARRAWFEAVDTLGLQDDVGADVLEELHLDLARLLLYRDELEFARTVLDAVPTRSRHDATYRLLSRRLVALERARSGLGVVPLTVDPDEVWVRPPSELPGRSDAGASLARWFPGRVEAASAEQVTLRLGVKEGDGPPRPGIMELPAARFDEWSRDVERAADLTPGRFVFVGTYEDGQTIIRVLPRARLDDALRPYPDPRRYLRQLGAVRG
jgi:tetratricopeptide (TPR) repeat protein